MKVDQEILEGMTAELGRESEDIPEILAKYDIEEKDFIMWSKGGATAVMAELALCMLSKNVRELEATIQSSLISFFLVGMKIGREYREI